MRSESSLLGLHLMSVSLCHLLTLFCYSALNANGSPVKDVASRQGSVVVNGAPISVNGNALPQAAGALS